MRFSFLVALFALAVAALGGGCSYPFTIDVASSVTLPIGAAANCEAATEGVMEGTLPPNGLPDEEGNLTHFEHRFFAGNLCRLQADWSGPLVDMDTIRTEAEDEMRERGLDPDGIDVFITSMDPTVTSVGLDSDGPMLARGVTYRAAVGVPRAPEVFVMEVREGTDVTNPNVTVTPARRLLRSANEAWRDRRPMLAVGTIDIDIDLDEAGAAPESLPDALRIDFTVTLEGDAAARTTLRRSDGDVTPLE